MRIFWTRTWAKRPSKQTFRIGSRIFTPVFVAGPFVVAKVGA
jgi:hypothetical protein